MVSSKGIAKICHEANRAYCETHGDMSLLQWEQSPAWQQEMVIKGVMFFMKHPTAQASEMHENWLKDKEADGWKYGPKKDPEKKEHPCMIPFHKLPPHQQAKDHIFRGICRALRPYYAEPEQFEKNEE